MEFTIKSKKLGKPVTFWRPDDGGYVHCDLNGREGWLGHQICKDGLLYGATLRHFGSLDDFKAYCRKWIKLYYEQYGTDNPFNQI